MGRAASVQCQERGRRRSRRVVVEPARDEHDATLEELFLQPAAKTHATSVPRSAQGCVGITSALLSAYGASVATEIAGRWPIGA
jgi:hypothetical protein